jgi:hypothetical protein
MKLVRLIGLVGWAGVAVAACGPKAGVDRNGLLSEMISTICGNIANCCSAATLDLDNVKCRDAVTFPMSGPIDDPQLRYDEVQAGACVDAVRSAAKACEMIDYSPCFKAFIGDAPPGASCTLGLDCKEGADGFGACTADGHCVQPSRGALNDPCSYSCSNGPNGVTCTSIYNQAPAVAQTACYEANGLACVLVGTAPICQPLTGDCRQRTDTPCPGGGACDPNTGACLAPVPLGGACTPSATCTLDAYCNNGVCQPRKPIHSLCGESDECTSGRCSSSGLCVDFSQVASLLCVVPS